MKAAITHSDLILYYYNECSAECKSFIDSNMASNPDWSIYLDSLSELLHDLDFAELPHPTTARIILEESVCSSLAVNHD